MKKQYLTSLLNAKQCIKKTLQQMLEIFSISGHICAKGIYFRFLVLLQYWARGRMSLEHVGYAITGRDGKGMEGYSLSAGIRD